MLGLSIFIFATFLMLFLGGTVFVHAPRGRVSRSFVAFALCTTAWMTLNYLENVAAFSPDTRKLLLRADFAAATMASAFIALFVMSFIGRVMTLRSLVASFAPAILLVILSFTRFLVTDIYFSEMGEIRFLEGPAFLLYAPVIVVYLIAPCILLLYYRRFSDPARRAQMGYIATGLIGATTISLTLNLFFQNVLPADLLRIGIYAMLLFVIGVVWAIVRHEFLNIRFVVVEILLLAILALLLTRTLLSTDLTEVIINASSFFAMLVLGFALIKSFLSEVRRREEVQRLAGDLEVSNKRLRELDDLKTTMVGIASHQIRGPLGGVRGYLSLLKSGDLGPLTVPQREAIGLNMNVLSRLINAVETFLDITKLESGKIMLNRELTDLREVADAVVEEFHIPMKKRGLEFVYEIPKTPVVARIDPDKTKHIIFNLIDNAMKYTEVGTVTARIRKEGRDAHFEVIDTGTGIPEEDIPRLFGKYERGELVVDRAGSGLGLYVVKMLTELQEGRVWVTSKGSGKGSTFSVTFPLAK